MSAELSESTAAREVRESHPESSLGQGSGFARLFIITLVASMFALSLTGLPNLTDNEHRIGGYVMDVIKRGHWICQRDTSREIASKPPMLTWVAAAASLPFGRVNRFSLYFPSALATLLVALILLKTGNRYFGPLAGYMAALVYVISATADTQMHMARYDALLSVPVTLGAIAAFRAWVNRTGWLWFWLMGAVATLVKGPVGIVLAAGGLFAALWEKRSGDPLRIRGSHWSGIALYLVICGGWLWLAYRQMGSPLIDKLLGRELIDHAVGRNMGPYPFERFYNPTLEFLQMFAPWSAVFAIACWRIWKRPAQRREARRFERFLFCWFIFGLALFSAVAHQRGRLLLPLIPPAALLVGREVAQLFEAWSFRKIQRLTTATAAAFLIVIGLYHHVLLQGSKGVQRTVAMRDAAREIRQRLGPDIPIYHHADVPFGLQFYLDNPSYVLSTTETVALLNERAPVAVLVTSIRPFRRQLGSSSNAREVFSKKLVGNEIVYVMSNVNEGPGAAPYSLSHSVSY